MKFRYNHMLEKPVSVFKRCIVPNLSSLHRKGDCGKIGVIGGSFEYTGAPYYAAYSALKVGADLSHVFCTKEAAIPIKSYSPELIVHPYLPTTESNKDYDIINNSVKKIENWFSRINVLVVGPGLGRDPAVLQTAEEVIIRARSASIPIVIDADGLFIVTQKPEIISNYKNCILTPNFNEFDRLLHSLNCKSLEDASNVLGGVTIVRKGQTDLITNGEMTIECSTMGSGRRCGGQGDVLAGLIATFYSWMMNRSFKSKISDQKNSDNNNNADEDGYHDEDYNNVDKNDELRLYVCYAACNLTRNCNHSCFQSLGRCFTTENLIQQIPSSFNHLYDPTFSKQRVE